MFSIDSTDTYTKFLLVYNNDEEIRNAVMSDVPQGSTVTQNSEERNLV